MGSEFADREKRPEQQPQDWISPAPSKEKQKRESNPYLDQAPNFYDPPPQQGPNFYDPPPLYDSPQYKRIDKTPEGAALLRKKIMSDPELAWLYDPNGKPPTPYELSRMRRIDSTPAGAERLRQEIMSDPERAWLLEPKGKPPTPYELAQMRWEQREREAEQRQKTPQPEREPAPTLLAQAQKPPDTADTGGHWETGYVVYSGTEPDTLKVVANWSNPEIGMKRNDLWPSDYKGEQKGSIPSDYPFSAEFPGQIVRRDAKGKAILIPFKAGQRLQIQPGDQVQRWITEAPQTQSPKPPVEQFQQTLKENAISRLEQNKARLTQVQGTYQNTQPNNEQWSSLRTLANRDQQLKRSQDQTNQELMTLFAKKEFSNSPLGRLVNQTPLGGMLSLPKSDPIQTEFLLNVIGTTPEAIDPQYRAQFGALKHRLELLHSVRQEMRAVHPALAVLDTAEVSQTANTPEQNAKLYAQMSSGFEGMRSEMSNLSNTVEQDPSKTLLFEALVPQTLSQIKDPAERQQAKDWVQQQHDKDAALKTVLGVGTLGLTVGGLLSGPLGWGANAAQRLFLGVAALNAAKVVYEFPQVMVMDMAARASATGGEKLTHQTPEEARMNLALGYANLALAGLDVGLTPRLIGKMSQIPGAVRSLAGLTRRQSQVLVNSVARHTGQLTDAGLEKLLMAVKAADEKTIQIVLNGDGTLTQMRPLGQAADKLETTVQARASGKAKKPPKLFDDYLNAPTVKPFIGTKVDPNNLPPGYLYGKMPLENGKFREVIYLPESNGDMVPLKLDTKGFIKKAPEGEYRIVKKTAYDKNVVTVPGKPGKLLGGDSEVHHLFADNLLRKTPFGQRALKLGAFNPDAGPNLIELASSTKNLADARKAHPNVKFSDFTHNTQHPEFDKLMQVEINREIRAVMDAKGLSRMKQEEFIQQMTKEEIETVLDESLSRMKSGLMNEDGKLYKKIKEKTRPNSGSLAQGEDLNNSEVT